MFLLLALLPPAAEAQEGVDEILRELEGMLQGGSMSIDQATAEALVARELPGVEKASGMKARRPIIIRLASREEAMQHIVGLIEEQLPPERLLPMEYAWKALGFLAPDASLADAVAALYGGQAGGFYDPSAGELVLLSDLPAMLQAPVIRHELVHALQDQTWDLEAWLGDAGDDEDRAAAVQAVLEGHATDVMNRTTLAQMGLEELMKDPDLALALEGLFDPVDGSASLLDPSASAALMAGMLPAGTPPALTAQLLFPYLTGATFVSGYIKNHPEDLSCAALYRRPPSTSAEILDPSLWESGTFIPDFGYLPGTNVPGFEIAYQSRLGRLLTWVLMTGQGDPSAGDPRGARWGIPERDRSVVVGSGWRGDRVVVVRPKPTLSGTPVPDSSAVLWASSWRDRAEAVAVAELLRSRHHPVAIEVRNARVHVVWEAGGAPPEPWMTVIRGWR
jgi:hypothetical protein